MYATRYLAPSVLTLVAATSVAQEPGYYPVPRDAYGTAPNQFPSNPYRNDLRGVPYGVAPPPGYRPGMPDFGVDPRGMGPVPPPAALDLEATPFGPPSPAPGYGMGLSGGPMSPQPYRPFSPDIPQHRPLSVRDYSRTFIEPPQAREIMLHDIITILVDEKAELLVQSRFNRQRNATYKAELKEFIRLDDDLNLASAATDGPGIDAQLRGRMQSDGATTDREGIRYRIAATVVGVLPNGNVVLEARKSIRSNDGMWEYTLTGTIASRDVKSDFTAVSENVANLQIEKHQTGKIADSTQRPWGMWLYDKLAPF